LSGFSPEDSRIAVFSHLHVTATEVETSEAFYPNYAAYLRPLFQGPMPRRAYDQMLAPGGSLVGGDVQKVIDKLIMLAAYPKDLKMSLPDELPFRESAYTAFSASPNLAANAMASRISDK
jgi:hypothetical protein